MHQTLEALAPAPLLLAQSTLRIILAVLLGYLATRLLGSSSAATRRHPKVIDGWVAAAVGEPNRHNQSLPSPPSVPRQSHSS